VDFDSLSGFVDLLTEVPNIWDLAHWLLREIVQDGLPAASLSYCHINRDVTEQARLALHCDGADSTGALEGLSSSAMADVLRV